MKPRSNGHAGHPVAPPSSLVLLGDEPLLTAIDLADRLGVCPATIHRWGREGLEGVVLVPGYVGATKVFTWSQYCEWQAEVDRRRAGVQLPPPSKRRQKAAQQIIEQMKKRAAASKPRRRAAEAGQNGAGPAGTDGHA